MSLQRGVCHFPAKTLRGNTFFLSLRAGTNSKVPLFKTPKGRVTSTSASDVGRLPNILKKHSKSHALTSNTLHYIKLDAARYFWMVHVSRRGGMFHLTVHVSVVVLSKMLLRKRLCLWAKFWHDHVKFNDFINMDPLRELSIPRSLGIFFILASNVCFLACCDIFWYQNRSIIFNNKYQIFETFSHIGLRKGTTSAVSWAPVLRRTATSWSVVSTTCATQPRRMSRPLGVNRPRLQTFRGITTWSLFEAVFEGLVDLFGLSVRKSSLFVARVSHSHCFMKAVGLLVRVVKQPASDSQLTNFANPLGHIPWAKTTLNNEIREDTFISLNLKNMSYVWIETSSLGCLCWQQVCQL